MSRIRSRNTKPEILVRKLVHRLGYRFKLHSSDLPGKPDIVLPRHKKIIFVHGCFWHLHSCRYGRVKPQANAAFWEAKRKGNKRRDSRHVADLKKSGWSVFVVWECQTRNFSMLEKRLAKFLSC